MIKFSRTTKHVKKWAILCLLAGLSLSQSACMKSLLSPGPPPDRVLLHIKNPDTYDKACMPFQIMITRPEAGFDLDTDNIALVFDGNLVRYLKEAKWSSPAPALTQRMVIDHLEGSQCLAGVIDESVGIHPRYRLIVHIREFQFNYQAANASPQAQVSFNLRLLDTKDATIIATASIRHSTQASGPSIRAMIEAMEQSMSEALDETNAFVITNLEPFHDLKRTKKPKS